MRTVREVEMAASRSRNSNACGQVPPRYPSGVHGLDGAFVHPRAHDVDHLRVGFLELASSSIVRSGATKRRNRRERRRRVEGVESSSIDVTREAGRSSAASAASMGQARESPRAERKSVRVCPSRTKPAIALVVSSQDDGSTGKTRPSLTSVFHCMSMAFRCQGGDPKWSLAGYQF